MVLSMHVSLFSTPKEIISVQYSQGTERLDIQNTSLKVHCHSREIFALCYSFYAAFPSCRWIAVFRTSVLLVPLLQHAQAFFAWSSGNMRKRKKLEKIVLELFFLSLRRRESYSKEVQDFRWIPFSDSSIQLNSINSSSEYKSMLPHMPFSSSNTL